MLTHASNKIIQRWQFVLNILPNTFLLMFISTFIFFSTQPTKNRKNKLVSVLKRLAHTLLQSKHLNSFNIIINKGWDGGPQVKPLFATQAFHMDTGSSPVTSLPIPLPDKNSGKVVKESPRPRNPRGRPGPPSPPQNMPFKQINLLETHF